MHSYLKKRHQEMNVSVQQKQSGYMQYNERFFTYLYNF